MREAFRQMIVLGLPVLAAAAGPLGAQRPEFDEAIEVRVANVDVVVTSKEGVPVAGLTEEDFELFVNGEKTPIEYFSAVTRGQPVAESSPQADDEVAGVDRPAVDRPLLAIVYDARSLRPAEASGALSLLGEQLPGLVEATAAIMVVRQGSSLVVEQPFTRNLEEVGTALEGIAHKRMPDVDAGVRSMLVRQLEGHDRPMIEAGGTRGFVLEEQARALLQRIRGQVEVERFEAEESARQLRSLVAALSPLRGRKAILLISAGLQTRPGEALFRLWWQKFGSIASSLGIFSLESEVGIDRYTDYLTDLVEEANAGRVAVYSFDPAGPRVLGSSVEYETLEAAALLDRDVISQQQTLLSLGRATGGLALVSRGDPAGLIKEMRAGFATYYSLGFTPAAEDERRERIRVELRPADLRARYVERYVARAAHLRLEERVLTTLLTHLSQNPLDVRVELGRPERQDDGTFVLPILVKVPIARLALLPDAQHHRGRLSVAVMARDSSGGLSPAATGEVPIDISNAEMVSAVSGLAGYRLRVRIGRGEQLVAVGVRDEIGRADTVLNFAVDPEHDS